MTFGALRRAVLDVAGVSSHFDFLKISLAHYDFWNEINRVEFERGYDREEYERPGSPSLAEMDLLSEEEFNAWLERVKQLLT